MANLESWQNCIISPKHSVRDAIENLIKTARRIVLIADENLLFFGTVTDGDIRRGMLRGIDLNSSILEIMNENPIVASKGLARAKVLELMSTKKVYQVPVVDEEFTLCGLHIWDELSTPISRDNCMVIMAGGKGSRLMPRTKDTPKPMLQIGGKPIIEHIILRAKKDGFSNFFLAIHHLGEVIENHFGDGSSLGIRISYIREKLPLGTAGALGLLDPFPNAPIVVTNGDVLADINYSDILEFHMQNQSTATMAVQLHETRNPFGVVETDGIDIVGYQEKPVQEVLVNAGVYVLNSEILNLLNRETRCNMPELFERVRERNLRTVAFPLHENWADLGTPEDFVKMLTEFQTLQRSNN